MLENNRKDRHVGAQPQTYSCISSSLTAAGVRTPRSVKSSVIFSAVHSKFIHSCWKSTDLIYMTVISKPSSEWGIIERQDAQFWQVFESEKAGDEKEHTRRGVVARRIFNLGSAWHERSKIQGFSLQGVVPLIKGVQTGKLPKEEELSQLVLIQAHEWWLADAAVAHKQWEKWGTVKNARSNSFLGTLSPCSFPQQHKPAFGGLLLPRQYCMFPACWWCHHFPPHPLLLPRPCPPCNWQPLELLPFCMLCYNCLVPSCFRN